MKRASYQLENFERIESTSNKINNSKGAEITAWTLFILGVSYILCTVFVS